MMLDRIVEVFCEVDDFCKVFLPQWEAALLSPGGAAPRGPQPGLSPSEIITLLLVLHSSGFKHLKSFYHGFAEPLAPFPACPATNTLSPCRFVALQKSAFVPLVFFLLSHLGTRTGLYYINSTALAIIIAPTGIRRSGSARQDGLVLWLQAAPRLQHRQ